MLLDQERSNAFEHALRFAEQGTLREMLALNIGMKNFGRGERRIDRVCYSLEALGQ